jgi:hypothetical protein
LFWEIAGYVCTFAVILGCVGEYIAEFTGIPKNDDGKHRISKLSLIILTVGIAGELLTAIRSSQISGEVIADLQTSVRNAKQSAADAAISAHGAANDAQTAHTLAQAASDTANDARTKARNATDSAGKAEGRANAAVAEAGDAQKKLGSLTTEADALIVNLKALNPRSLVLRDAIEDIKSKLLPFAGQPLVVELCGSPYSNGPSSGVEGWERRETSAVLSSILTEDAKWGNGIRSEFIWEKCVGYVGITVFVSSDAPSNTVQAAQALNDELSNLLPGPQAPLLHCDPRGSGCGYQEPLDNMAPQLGVKQNPALIVVVVAAMPMQSWGSRLPTAKH